MVAFKLKAPMIRQQRCAGRVKAVSHSSVDTGLATMHFQAGPFTKRQSEKVMYNDLIQGFKEAISETSVTTRKKMALIC